MIIRLIWTIWTPMSSVPKKADKFNLSLSLGFWPGEVMEKSWNFFLRFLWEPCKGDWRPLSVSFLLVFNTYCLIALLSDKGKCDWRYPKCHTAVSLPYLLSHSTTVRCTHRWMEVSQVSPCGKSSMSTTSSHHCQTYPRATGDVLRVSLQ